MNPYRIAAKAPPSLPISPKKKSDEATIFAYAFFVWHLLVGIGFGIVAIVSGGEPAAIAFSTLYFVGAWVFWHMAKLSERTR